MLLCFQVPAALITFSWDPAVQADIAAAGGKSPALLKPELLENIRTLSWADRPFIPELSLLSPSLARQGWSCASSLTGEGPASLHKMTNQIKSFMKIFPYQTPNCHWLGATSP